jgi:hypothetical protein
MIEQIGPGVLHYRALHIVDQHGISHRVTKDMDRCKISFDDIQSSKVILDFRAEGHCDQTASLLIKYLQSIPVMDLLVVYNSCVDVSALNYKAVSIPNYMTNHSNWLDYLEQVSFNDIVERKFLCLMRRPSMPRAGIARALLDINCDVRMSFACQSTLGLQSYQLMFPDIQLPLILDDMPSQTNDADNVYMHDQTNTLFHSCLFNLVVETSDQTTPKAWHSLFITEKTFKSFGLRQIPIWFAVPGLVREIRKLGFDLFDDIVNHDYDKIEDQTERFQAVIDQVHRLDQTLSVSRCQEIRRSIKDRLNENFNLLKKHEKESNNLFNQAVNEFILS